MVDPWNSINPGPNGKEDQRSRFPGIGVLYGHYPPRSFGMIDTIVVHHTASGKDTTWESVYRLHTGPDRNWDSIGYHFGIRRGSIAYLGAVDTIRACVSAQNHHIICVVLTGNYEAEQVDQNDLSALASLISDIQGWAVREIGRKLAIKCHGDLNQTACPGRNLRSMVERIARGEGPATPQSPPAGPDEPSKDDIVFAASKQTISVNPVSALYLAGRGNGYIPTGGECARSGWTMQPFQEQTGNARRVYYCRTGDWSNVRWKSL